MVLRLAIVPARGGSKRIPDKNIRDFCGRPMIAHILDTARDSGLFDTIHVSTESPRIAEVSSRLGCRPDFLRPERLADDFTPLMPVINYVTAKFRELGKEFDEVWLLMACAPLIEVSDLKGAAEMFVERGGRIPLLSVAPYPSPVEWAYRLDHQNMLAPIWPEMISVRSQDISASFYDTGSFCIFPGAIALQGSADCGHFGYVLSREKAIDIDSEEDLRFAAAVFAARNSSPPR